MKNGDSKVPSLEELTAVALKHDISIGRVAPDAIKPMGTPTTDPHRIAGMNTDKICANLAAGDETPPGAVAMTQEQCENWIMLKGQTGERWFKLVILDPEVAEDPTIIALMETVSEMIFAGIQGMPFTEAEAERSKKANLAAVPPIGLPGD